MINGLAICAGSGGLELGLKIALGDKYQCVGYIEREAYSAAIIVARIQDKTLDSAPIWDDITTFDSQPWSGLVDIISAGFPCQPWSTAGKQKKTKDERWIWDSIYRVICEVKPGMVFLENVPNLKRGGLQIILRDLAKCGYAVEWDVFSAKSMGAPHIRKRLFILAYSNNNGFLSALGTKDEQRNRKKKIPNSKLERTSYRNLANTQSKSQRESGNQEIQSSDKNIIGGSDKSSVANPSSGRWKENLKDLCGGKSDIAGKGLEHTDNKRLERYGINKESSYEFPSWPPSPTSEDWEAIPESLKPAVRRVVDGMAPWMDRLRSCGNGVVPVVAAMAFLHLGSRAGLIDKEVP